MKINLNKSKAPTYPLCYHAQIKKKAISRACGTNERQKCIKGFGGKN